MNEHYSLEFIRHRYNRLAAIYPLFEVAFALPPGIRARAVERLELSPGGTVLEIGCGTGRNLEHLVKAVGPCGRVYGVDYSDGMLARAQKLCDEHRWNNVTLLRQDAQALELPGPVDGALFSFSYTVIPQPQTALARVWTYLRPGRHVVILDGPLFPGILGRVFRPLVLLISKATVLGDPDAAPWQDLEELTSAVEREYRNLGTYHICRGTKS